MMRFLGKFLMKALRSYNEDRNKKELEPQRYNAPFNNINRTTMHVYPAVGGKVVEVAYHEISDHQIHVLSSNQSSDYQSRLYMIKDGEELAEGLANILVIEGMKR